MSNDFDKELQGKQSFICGYLEIAILDTNLERNPTVFQGGGRERDRVFKDRKIGTSKGKLF